MAAPRSVRKKLAQQRAEEKRNQLIANAEKRLPKRMAAIYAKQKERGGRDK